MKRIEIICNNSVFEDVQELLLELRVKAYTKIENVHGVGTEGQKWGDAVWPQENFIMTSYCGSDSVSEIVDGFRAMKTRSRPKDSNCFFLTPKCFCRRENAQFDSVCCSRFGKKTAAVQNAVGSRFSGPMFFESE